MSSIIFDLETNGLLDSLNKIHCASLIDLETEELSSYNTDLRNIKEAIDTLSNADVLIGHNIMGFDVKTIEKLYPDFKFKGKLVDTLVISRLIYTNLKALDLASIKKRIKLKKPHLPKNLIGSHSLEAWGHRLNLHKGDYKLECEQKGIDPWESYNDSMGSYCDQDARVTLLLYKKLLSKNYSQQAIDIEHYVHSVCLQQTDRGVYLDKHAAVELYSNLCQIREKTSRDLIEIFGSWIAPVKEFTPKRDNQTLGYKEGCTLTKVKVVEFNPGSRQQIADRLIKTRGWKPKVFTDGGSPQVNEKVLEGLPYPEVPKLLEYLLVNKRISQVAEADGAWLKLEQGSRLHGRVNPMGTVTGRAAHYSPNLGQVPKVGKEYGEDCRKCFTATPGMTLVGADASGLQLRNLAHYMARYDGGAYTKLILEGDIHTANQLAAGLDTRDQAKTFIYALLFGGGDYKIGTIVGKGSAAGKQLKAQFFHNLPAFAKLQQAVADAVRKRGWIQGLDGRIVYIRSPHSALNFLLMSAEGAIMKQATKNYHEILKSKGLIHGIHYHQVLWVHDEWQVECKEEYSVTVGESMVEGIRMVTQQFNFRCPLDGEYKIGKNWAETH
jgi:DNA polymerase I-like protein with 3'-5' exonuclease and polymerase domains